MTETTARLLRPLTVLHIPVDDRVFFGALMPTLESRQHQSSPTLEGFTVGLKAVVHVIKAPAPQGRGKP